MLLTRRSTKQTKHLKSQKADVANRHRPRPLAAAATAAAVAQVATAIPAPTVQRPPATAREAVLGAAPLSKNIGIAATVRAEVAAVTGSEATQAVKRITRVKAAVVCTIMTVIMVAERVVNAIGIVSVMLFPIADSVMNDGDVISGIPASQQRKKAAAAIVETRDTAVVAATRVAAMVNIERGLDHAPIRAAHTIPIRLFQLHISSESASNLC